MLLKLWFDPHVSSLSPGSSQHPDLRGPSVPSSPSCTPNTPTMLCSGNSESNLNTSLNINLNSSLNSNYHTLFSSSTGLSKLFFSLCVPSFLSLGTLQGKFVFIMMTSLRARSWSPFQVFIFHVFVSRFFLFFSLWNWNLLKCRRATEQ